MTLKERITEDMKAAMRAGERERLGVIRLLLAAIKQREVDGRVALDDAATLAVIEKQVKQRRDSIEAYAAAAREDLAAKERAELAVLQAYLPQRLGAEALAQAVAALVAEAGAQSPADMGKVMALAKARLTGQADMTEVSAAVKSALALRARPTARKAPLWRVASEGP